ncbi:MAG: bifunctional glutamate N-acetyltransferase/amino-acid acetyltransferase ArgJ [Rhodospirillaceae bacterium]
MSSPVPSPLTPEVFPELPPIAGVTLAVGQCGIRYQDRTDLMVAVLEPGTTVGGVFTRSLTASAPVEWCRRALDGGRARAVVVNSGNSNAFTGRQGEITVAATVDAVAERLGCAREEVFVASTGVIGQPMPPSIIPDHLATVLAGLDAGAWSEAARAIMTTDTFPKMATRQAMIGDTPVTLNGFAKGSGMIAPDMATMLAFIFTDAAIESAALKQLIAESNQRSFNCITVDGDTSTSDTVLLFATGKAGNKPVANANARRFEDFRRALDELMLELAQLIVRDGEGAGKFVTITVTGADGRKAARRVAFAIANSPLVKTAIAGEDANWGRIVMAVGKAGERADRDRLMIFIGGIQVTAAGAAVPGYDEAPVAAHMKGREIEIRVDLGVGQGEATVWTCDLTHGYIDINGSYRS